MGGSRFIIGPNPKPKQNNVGDVYFSEGIDGKNIVPVRLTPDQVEFAFVAGTEGLGDL